MAEQKPAAKKPAPPPPPASPGLIELIGGAIFLLVILPLIVNYFASPGGVGMISSVIAFLKTVATIIVMIAIVIMVYSFIRIQEISAEETKKLGLALNWNMERKQKNTRWEKVEEYMTSLNSSDWKIAILEADNILDEIVERMGYDGPTLGERMKKIEASDFPYLDETWQVHKLRNAIAHKGTDYPLTRSEAEQAINMYHRVFKELGYLS